MNHSRKILQSVVILLALLLSSRSFAGQFEDGKAAYDRYEYQTALKLLRPLAEQGNADAQYLVSDIYEYGGHGVEGDEAAAINWLEKAAQQGNVDAEYRLGSLYYVGGVRIKQDKSEADKWMRKVAETFRKPAENGDGEAQMRMAGLYMMGLKPDLQELYFWDSLAALSKMDMAADNAAHVAEQLTPDQKAEVDSRVKEWKLAHPKANNGTEDK